MTDATQPGAREPAGTRVVAVTVDDPVLGGSLRLALGEHKTTVLVGLNGAGKSRILESLHDTASASVNLTAEPRPLRAKIEFELDGLPLVYSYATERVLDADLADRMSWYWKEQCVDAVAGRKLWQVGGGSASVDEGPEVMMLPIIGLLHLRTTSAFHMPPQVDPLRRLLRGVRLMRAGVPRHGSVREALRLQRPRHNAPVQSGAYWTGKGDERLVEAIKILASWHETERERFDAVVEIGRRLQVLQSLIVQVKDLEGSPNHPDAPAYEAEVFVDGVNFGYLSDGTQRLIELVIKLVDPAVTVLLLEEPETSVHPGLLRRLLAELDALGPGKQVVISTHSPMVIDWTRAEDVRLVERTSEGVTSVRSLSADERARLGIYLDDDLALSDFMFSGAMD